jgi:inorganic triphosphatase YgiF
VFRSSRSEIIVLGSLAAIAVLCTFLAVKGYQLSQRTEANAEATRIETQERTEANRAILNVLCQRQNYTYKVLRQDARDSIKQTRAALRQTRQFLRRGASLNGITPRDLRLAIRRHRDAIRQNRRFIRELDPLNCKTFAGRFTATVLPVGASDVIIQITRDVQRLKADVTKLNQRVDGFNPPGRGNPGGG